ncbi:RNA:NAD 2'-phosphotransferase [Olavius algarvensis Delta 1 endosymbiont]|nr:RNA:NAD 2'-phosphotransferase [Olavius algarvensis Delta 1 endosymbiont]
MAVQRAPKKLAKFFDYILSRRPDEFGLVPDADGFVKIKEFLKAVGEEDGFRYVRRAHLNEIMLSVPGHPFEISDNYIRSTTRDRLPQHRCTMEPPKLLYTCVRQKAYPHVHEKGIRPAGHPRVILSAARAMAERIGRRLDHSAVTLTIQTQTSMDQGVIFFQAGENLFLADFIPAQCFTGPPLPKDQPLLKKPDASAAVPARKPAGGYHIDMDDPQAALVPKSKRGGHPDGKRIRKPKRKRERPPWRR